VRIIPVIDLRGGKVVHAVGGRSERYKPLRSVLVDNPDPLGVALAFERLGFQELYIADLDAICSEGRNLSEVERIASRTGLKLMVDAGFRRATGVKDYIERGVKKIVLATETLEGFEEVRRVIAEYGVRVVASIDMKFGRVVAGSKAMRLPLEELIRRFEAAGASEILLLSLDRVGTGRGASHETLKRALSHATVPVIVGGGIRDIADIRRLQSQGASGVLIATALHRGAITKGQLKQMGLAPTYELDR
jgi:phosphoribosylformimino-5-aminoimidazole carboxamide ribotide isomerase